jgi:hypothetical protein
VNELNGHPRPFAIDRILAGLAKVQFGKVVGLFPDL